jgi:hypothetical protein
VTPGLSLALDNDALDRLADVLAGRVVEALAGRSVEASQYLAPAGAADYLGVTRKRIHDLKSMGAIKPDGFDGRTPLYLRSTLDRYVRNGT